MAGQQRELVREIVGGEPYESYALGEHIVAAPGVCDGEPTFKYTRINVEHALDLLTGGWTVEQVAQAYQVSVAAVRHPAGRSRRCLDLPQGKRLLSKMLLQTI